ncbi:hypothetical protein RMB03_17310 [Acinetobacter sp. V91_7]|uniref:hypothetical protein n=1 Tax=unclassified Acinetobacter TaxID=196816 RepID=UPI00287CB552|nr:MULTISPECIES: hypothetical protein [unclassified Acinetobacter]MDS7935685.1 hypothetical protein [Acinetobacter sp. V91_4B]MDS7964707.1 hypothetical protein [Acinetobacter sp. V91_7]MDS8025598.1 hypothetical protein [Acinetobacter sp. V91_13]
MKRILLSIFPICLCSTSFAGEVLTKDHLDRPIIKKTFDIKDQNGNNIKLSQDFLIVGEDELLYLRGSSSPVTLKYGEEKCRSDGKVLDIDFGSKIIKRNQQYILSCSNDKNLKNTIINKSYSSSPQEQSLKGFNDVTSLNQFGEKIITRTSTAIAPNGRKYNIQQQFQEISENKLLYILNSSTPETLQYNNELCKSVGGIDATDKGVRLISKDATSAIICDNVKKNNIDTVSSTRQSCNISALSNSDYNGRAYANNIVSGTVYYTNATGSLIRRITVNGYSNEAIDYLSNQTGNGQIFLNAYIGAPNTYPIVTTGQLGCSSSSQGVLIAS